MRLMSRRRREAQADHRRANPIEKAKRRFKYIRRNPHRWAKMYADPRWKRLRERFLAANPVCALCDWPANQLDHIDPHGGDWAKFLDIANLQGLCRDCHSRKTAAERRGWRPGR